MAYTKQAITEFVTQANKAFFDHIGAGLEDAAADADAAAAAIAAHAIAVDPHPQYLTTAEAGAAYATTAQGAKADTAVQPAALTSGLATKADLVGGFVPTSQLPSLSLTATVSVASQAAMLALTTTQVQPGDIAVRTDGAGTFILTATDPSVLANWTLLRSPTDVVVTVNGQAGTVVLGKADVGLGNADNTADLAKPVSTAQQTALNLKAPLANPTFTGTVGGVTKTHVGLGNADNTSDLNKPVSTTQQTALNAKAPISPSTGVVLIYSMAYADAYALGARPTVPAGARICIWGGEVTDPDPTWMALSDYRDLLGEA